MSDGKLDLSSLDSVGSSGTNFTNVTHHKTYPAIDPARPELSQAGRTKVIIASRNKAVLDEAVAELTDYASSIESPTVYVSRTVDQANNADVVTFWESLAAEGTTVDVLVLNATLFTEAKPLHELSIDRIGRELDINVKGPLHLVQKFRAQHGFKESPKTILNVSTCAIHMQHNGIVQAQPSYTLTKSAATLACSVMADTVSPEELQIINFHPGMVYSDAWSALGITKDMLPFDEYDLPSSFAVWAASPEARFLHGRFVWVNWDVTELGSGINKKNLEANPDYLRISVIGLRDVDRDPAYKDSL